MWTLILTLTVLGNSTHSITVPNLPSKEICRQIGQDHINKYTSSASKWHGGYVGVYTCVEQKQ
jgi:hypothetical protein